MRIRRRFVLFFALFFLLSFSGSFADEKLVFTAAIIRHGDRTPFAEIKSTKITYKWPQGIGELTPTGMHQEYLLGRELRARYIDKYQLLPPTFQNNTLYVLSTDYNRTIMSALSLLAGLYPPGTGPVLRPGTPALPHACQPVPVHTIPNGQKNIIAPAAEDPGKFIRYFKKYALTQKAWREENIRLANDYKRWSRILGMNIRSLEDTLIPGDHLNCMTLYHIPYPDGLTKEDAQKLIKTRNYAAALRFVPREMASFMASGFFAKLLEDFNLAMAGRQTYKFILYSGHDDSILGLMSALNAPLKENPPYASHIEFELYRDDLQYMVRVRYNGAPLFLSSDKSRDSFTIEEFKNVIKPCIEKSK